MASVWKRLQRVNKRAAKFQYTASYHRIDLHATPKWRPNKLSVVWTRRSRRVITEPLEWEPSLKDPLKGTVIWPVPENRTVAITLFKDARGDLEDKDWTFVLEDVSPGGKRRRLASAPLNVRRYASLEPTQHHVALELQPTSAKIKSASIHLTLHCVLLREGQATDEDMQSLASLLSVNNNSDIAPLEDLDEDDYSLSDNSNSIKQMLEVTQQLERMTSSLTGTPATPATPASIPSLTLDMERTPTAAGPPAMPDSPATPTTPSFETSMPPLYIEEETTVETHTETFKPIDTKEVVFKPRTISKHNLKPLELKTNLNLGTSPAQGNQHDDEEDATPTAAPTAMPLPPARHTDRTPVQELLEWCQEATREYRVCRVTNLTTSFRNGLAFCAIIHRYRPDLVDFSALDPADAETNVRIALDASAALGVSPVLTARDVLRAPAPDRLAVMTHLFQLRAHFTGSELHVEQLGAHPAESSYLVGRHDTDSLLNQRLFTREIPRRQHTLVEQESMEERQAEANKRDEIESERRSEGVSVTDNIAARPTQLMTRKQLVDPFGSDDEEDTTNKSPQPVGKSGSVSPPAPQTPDLPKPAPQLVSRHDALKERARQLLEATRAQARQTSGNAVNGDTSPDKVSEEARQAALRERARRLIADARAGVVSPTSPLSPSRRRPTVEIISRQSMLDEIAAAGGMEKLDNMLNRGDSTPVSPTSVSPLTPASPMSTTPPRADPLRDGENGNETEKPKSTRTSPLHSFSALIERLTPDKEAALDELRTEGGTTSYIASELEALEREQTAIDEQAAALEKELRAVMETNNNTEEEDRLMARWFTLVNKKNALLRRQMQLNILEQEEDLTRKCQLLEGELRTSLAVEEWRKTPGQRRRELLLLHELLAAVDERDRLVHELDEQEKAIEDDDEIQRNLSNVEIQRKNNCSVQ